MMLDLVSLDEIKPIKDDIRCRTCLKFNTILHASDVWKVEEDNFVRIALPEVKSCFLTDKICKGLLLREEDYETIDACTSYEESGEWDGINKTFINVVQGLINYLILTENKEYNKETIMGAAKRLNNITVVTPNIEEEEKNTSIMSQFGAERSNYEIMEAVRREMNDS